MSRLRVVSDHKPSRPKQLKLLSVADFGSPEANELAADIVADLRAYQAGEIAWSQIDRATLLVGAPGTGKTALAAAIAREAGMLFFPTSYAAWQRSGSGALGDVLQAMAAAFEKAAETAPAMPALLFIDELDSLRARGLEVRDKWDDWNAYLLNALLLHIDGADAQEGVFIMAATNRPEVLDAALLRPGRFSRHVRLSLPSEAARAGIFRFYADQAGQTFTDAEIAQLAALSIGFTGAAIEAAVKSAHRTARRAGRPLSFEDVIGAIDPAPEPAELSHRCAVHEAGHILALLATDLSEDIAATIAGAQRAATAWHARKVATTLPRIVQHIAVSLAGREAERLVLGDCSIGSGSRDPDCDLARATRLAIDAVAIEGLGEEIFWTPDRAELAAHHPARLAEAKALLAKGQALAAGIVAANEPLLLALAEALTVRRALNHDAILQIAEGFTLRQPTENTHA